MIRISHKDRPQGKWVLLLWPQSPDLGGDEVGWLACELAGVGLVAWAACIVAGGLGDGPQQAFREEHSHALRVAQRQDVDELHHANPAERSQDVLQSQMRLPDTASPDVDEPCTWDVMRAFPFDRQSVCLRDGRDQDVDML